MSRSPRRLEVFAVEPTAIQLSWGDLDAQEVEVRAGDHRATVDHPGGPATVELPEQVPDRRVTVEVRGDGWTRRLAAATPPHPPGEEVFRLATVSDLHLGLETFGVLGTMREHPAPEEAHPARCTRAALRDARAWGAQRLVAKGDLTDHGRQAEWDAFIDLVAEVDLPCEVIPGNHERRHMSDVTPSHALRGTGIVPLDGGVRAVDLPGIRLVLVDTTQPGRHGGTVRPVADDAVELVGSSDRPVLVIGHHYAMALPVLTFWPPGIPSTQMGPLFRRMHASNPDVLYTAGHTHRHRRRVVGGVESTEVGSPKDYPGTWGGYVVHEGGIRQVVRRVSDPGCLPWLEYTRLAALGVWSRFSPGRLDQRCFSLAWQRDRVTGEPAGGGAVDGVVGPAGSGVEPLT